MMVGQHILVVDDDQDTLLLLAMVLEGQGYRISRATSGEEALEIASDAPPDLVILDVMMPNLDGYSVARHLRGYEATAQIPIMIFTAKGQLDDKAAGFEAGADDYLTKPIHPAQLIARVQAVLARSAQRVGLARAARGGVLACVGSSPGAGTTTVAVNVALALAGEGDSVLLANMVPGVEGDPPPGALPVTPAGRGLAALLNARPPGVEDVLASYAEGVWLLPGTMTPAFAALREPATAERLVDGMAHARDFVVMDLGAEPGPEAWNLIAGADRVVLVAEATRSSLVGLDRLAHEMEQHGCSPERASVVVVHHRPAAEPLRYAAIQAGLGVDQLAVIPADPALAGEANDTAVPLLLLDEDSDLSREFIRLAEGLRTRLGHS